MELEKEERRTIPDPESSGGGMDVGRGAGSGERPPLDRRLSPRLSSLQLSGSDFVLLTSFLSSVEIPHSSLMTLMMVAHSAIHSTLHHGTSSLRSIHKNKNMNKKY